MKIVSWNCNGALRKKFEKLTELNADIYIVEECEDPARCNSTGYLEWAGNCLWIGDNKNKGIGIFPRNGHKISQLDWSVEYKDHNVKYFLPCMVDDNIKLLGVWAHGNDSPNFGYIGQFWKFLQINKANFSNIIIAGDFNSNACWDVWDRWWNHSDVVRELKGLGIQSAYHKLSGEKQGEEKTPTFYMHRKIVKPYHIDYFFCDDALINKNATMNICNRDEWLIYSDHIPIILELAV